MQLFSITVHAHIDTTSINPTTTIVAWTQILKIAHNIIAKVVLQMLVTSGITCFSTCPYTIKDSRTILEIEAQACKMIVPVRVLDNYLHFGIYSFSWSYHQFPTCFIHQLQAILCPSHISFCCHLYRTLTAGKEEVVKQKFIEMLCCVLCNILHNLSMFWVRITESFKLISLIHGICNTASHLYTLLKEEILCFLKGSIIYNQ